MGECIEPCIGNALKYKGKVDLAREENGNVENNQLCKINIFHSRLSKIVALAVACQIDLFLENLCF